MNGQPKPIVICRWRIAEGPWEHVDDGREVIDVKFSIPVTTTVDDVEMSLRELMDEGVEVWIAMYALPKVAQP